MNIYAETNFILEIALEQEECDACAGILQLAASGRAKVIIPAFSLAEPWQAISSKAKVRARLGADWRLI